MDDNSEVKSFLRGKFAKALLCALIYTYTNTGLMLAQRPFIPSSLIDAAKNSHCLPSTCQEMESKHGQAKPSSLKIYYIRWPSDVCLRYTPHATVAAGAGISGGLGKHALGHRGIWVVVCSRALGL